MRTGYIRSAWEEVKSRVIELVQIFESRENEWDETLKVGMMILLFKKSDQMEVNNFRGAHLLEIISRTLEMVIAKRVA